MKRSTAKIRKMSRRLGIRIYGNEKSALTKRDYPPGAHGPKGRGRRTEYGLQLAEKQKAKIIYNIAERQFRGYYEKATQKKGDSGENLQRLLELRLDNVIYRLGLAKTRNQARQLVNHGFFLINGKKVDIPSCQVRVKDEITIKPQKLKTKVFEPAENNLKKIQLPGWLNFDSQTLKARVVAEPTAAEMERSFNPKLIIEVYSK
ncbi:MAG: 30S ribosomal protein S4 [Candidatus Buchananbacteria bacterium RIFCSPLOWO2_01_FULL_56_15]|uniref:Small ribosomal subunit protein uS4 n=2 Tax=Candidatus Buchananiibacteriota TaxID=1817903 RepID=A0A1G1YF45_9BACT|nr:MAG: 30S ribosomal protein S4 [Candidatus Buchananbacteria bacterium RIFCSPHIGHO2_02_FULL_56_16]OGY55001.1 MAG: 30S ribosomal protein S4 [Candidatus Buchananbacteria bacterium RIFCSPLOWO2_01_FULL_56_15]